MNSTLTIKDLEVSKELSGKELAAVRGGLNISSVGSQYQTNVSGGFLSGINNVGVYAPTVTQGGDTSFKYDSSTITNVLGQLQAATVQS